MCRVNILHLNEQCIPLNHHICFLSQTVPCQCENFHIPFFASFLLRYLRHRLPTSLPSFCVLTSVETVIARPLLTTFFSTNNLINKLQTSFQSFIFYQLWLVLVQQLLTYLNSTNFMFPDLDIVLSIALSLWQC